MSDNTNIMLTGATSFIGDSFINKFEDYKLIKYSRNKNGRVNKTYTEDSYESLMKILQATPIDTCLHIANFKDENQNYETKRESQFLQNIKSYGISKIIYISSYWLDIAELQKSSYVTHKKKIETEVIENFQHTIFRVGDIFGDKDKRDKLIPYLLLNESKDKLDLKGHPQNIIKPTHVDDVSSVLNETIKNNIFENKIINLYGSQYSLESFINLYKDSRKKNFSVKFLNENLLNFFYNDTSHETLLINNDLKKQLKNLKQ